MSFSRRCIRADVLFRMAELCAARIEMEKAEALALAEMKTGK